MRSGVGTTEGFEMKVGLHQDSALSPFLFKGVLWSMMYADDEVLCGETIGGGG